MQIDTEDKGAELVELGTASALTQGPGGVTPEGGGYWIKAGISAD